MVSCLRPQRNDIGGFPQALHIWDGVKIGEFTEETSGALIITEPEPLILVVCVISEATDKVLRKDTEAVRS